ncbi:2-hydroxyacid dehydrogenase [Bacillus timonensis]|uniref:2-hydroxyacid dehydrogenase n=1 Tax=Bacillus timonensis TaxID=1033734 RepID=UPI0002886B46|nr:D-glycerate dehydrogenase [Bacillus timonensis]
MKSKVYITRKLPEGIVSRLSERFEVRMYQEEDSIVPRDILLNEVKDVDGIICLLTDKIDQELLDKAKNLKVVANIAVGYNNIDVNAAVKKGVVVTNTPGVLTEATADLTFALLMATARRIPDASNYLRSGEWGAWSLMQMTGQEIYEATIGIIGLGRIAESLVKRAKGFNMRVIYYNRTRKVDKEAELGIEYCDLHSLLQQSDFVSILIPYSPDVHHFIGKSELQLMKKNAILINTARGGIVDEGALYDALVKGQIWGAGLDVFEKEPVPVDHPLLSLPNVVTLPHIGSSTVKTRLQMATLAVDNIINVFEGKEPLTPVNS